MSQNKESSNELFLVKLELELTFSIMLKELQGSSRLYMTLEMPGIFLSKLVIIISS
jgi:hypothetical protein